MGIYKKVKNILICGGLTLIVASGIESCDEGDQRTSIERVGAGALNGVHNGIEYSQDCLDWLDEKAVKGRNYLRGNYDR